MATDKTYFERVFPAPSKGWNDSAPENMISMDSSPFMETVYVYQNELRNFPCLRTHPIAAPGIADPATGFHGFPIRSVIAAKVLDSNTTFSGASTTQLKLGTFVLTDNGLYALRPYWRNGYTFPGPVPWTVTDPNWIRLSTGSLYGNYGSFKNPWPIICSEGTLFYSITDGLELLPVGTYAINLYSYNHINGEQQIKLDATHQLGAYYMGVLSGHLILVNTITVDTTTGVTNYETTRIRWSASGDFTQFDPNTNIGAGFADLSETPDETTGLILMGRNALIFRTNGITEMFPLGGIAPFGFNHMWASDRGIGNVLCNTVSNYGSLGCFIAEDDIYAVSTSNFKPISGTAKVQIYKDLDSRLDDSSVVTTIIPALKGGHVHLLYCISIVQTADSSVMWFYSITGDFWMRRTFSSGNLNFSQIFTAPGVLVPTGDDIVPNPDPLVPTSILPAIKGKNKIAAFPTVVDTAGTTPFIKYFDPDIADRYQMQHDFRVEDFAEGKQPTIHKLRIRYRDIQAGNINYIITLRGEGVDDLPIVVNYTGIGDNKLRTLYVDAVFTAKSPQISFSLQSASVIGFKRVAIISITMCGNLADGPEL